MHIINSKFLDSEYNIECIYFIFLPSIHKFLPKILQQSKTWINIFGRKCWLVSTLRRLFIDFAYSFLNNRDKPVRNIGNIGMFTKYWFLLFWIRCNFVKNNRGNLNFFTKYFYWHFLDVVILKKYSSIFWVI